MSTEIILEEKTCTHCNESWPADSEFFLRVPDNKDGLSGKCRACRAGYDRCRNGTASRHKAGQLTQNLCGVFSALVKKQEQAALTKQ